MRHHRAGRLALMVVSAVSLAVLTAILGYLLNALFGGAERLILSWNIDKGQD